MIFKRFFTVHNSLLPNYRSDIDGLRAIAVLLVIGFHAYPSLIPGGYIGVDVFFVISGYLISKIIIIEINNNNFTILNFYVRRVLRLFPSLLLILIFSYFYGEYILQIDELKQLYKNIAAGSFFVSNIIYWLGTGYFDSASDTKPLLHLWSLGVEEQFYLLWPLLLIFFLKSKIKIRYIIITLICISFLINLFLSINNSPSAFYLIQSRIWELLGGAYLASWELNNPKLSLLPEKIKSFATEVGLLFIIVSAFIFKATDPYPGWRALIPVLGSMIVIANRFTKKNKLSNFLSIEPLVLIGLISYPLYLWHWPILTFSRIERSETLPSLLINQLLLLTLVLSLATYFFIEKPIKRFKNRKTISILLFILIFVFGLFNWYKFISVNEAPVAQTQEQTSFYKAYANEPSDRWLRIFEKHYRHECDFFDIEKYYSGSYTKKPRYEIDPICFTSDPSHPNKIMLWGDSHAQMLRYGLEQTIPDSWQILQITSSGCPPSIIFQLDSEDEYCAKSNWLALKVMGEIKPNIVLIARSEGHDVKEMDQITQKLTSLGVGKVVFLGPAPHWTGDLPKIYLRKLWAEKPTRTMTGISRNTIEKNKELKAKFLKRTNNNYIDLIEIFCNDDGCLTRLGDNLDTDLVTWDYGHLTSAASIYLAKQLWPKLLN